MVLKRAVWPVIPWVVMVFFSACAGTPASRGAAASAVPNPVTYTLDDLHMKIDMPGDLYVITRDSVSHPEELKARELDVEATQAGFAESSIYLDAMGPDFSYEFVITMVEYEVSRERWDLSAMSDAELREILLSDKAELEALDIAVAGEQVYKTGNAVFLTVSFSQPLENFVVYSTLYYTTVNGMMINIALSSPTVPLSPERLALQKAVIDSISFTRVPK
jgi:hypothetical protein